MALRSVPEHPKFHHLKRLLGTSKGVTLGYLEAVWHFTGHYAPQGNVGKHPDVAIESWVEWEGAPGALIDALCEARWIDRDPVHRLIIHDWHEHADSATKKTLGRRKLEFVKPTAVQNPATIQTPDGQLPDDVTPPGRQAGAGAGAGPEAGAVPEPDGSADTGRTSAPAPEEADPMKPSLIVNADWFEFKAEVEKAGGHWSGPDWQDAWFTWRTLDVMQREAATDGIRIRAGTEDFALRATPVSYLRKRMWERSRRSAAVSNRSKAWEEA